MKLPIATLLIVLASAAALAKPRAGEPPLPSDQPGYCDQHADECRQMRQRHDQFCKRNPNTCAAGERRREARRAYCKAHPDECQAVRDEARARRDAIRKRCEQDPKACEDRREQRRTMREEQRKQMRREMPERCRANPAECPERGQEEAAPDDTGKPARSGPPR